MDENGEVRVEAQSESKATFVIIAIIAVILTSIAVGLYLSIPPPPH